MEKKTKKYRTQKRVGRKFKVDNSRGNEGGEE
jgi:hypothetical protein